MLYTTTRFLLTPDAEPVSGGAPVTNEPGADHSLPDNLPDLIAMCEHVAEVWEQHPEITMVDGDAATLMVLTQQAKNELHARNTAGGQRRPITARLENLDEVGEQGMRKVKAYLVGRFESEQAAQDNFGRYGIVNENGNYRLARDRQTRLLNLPMMLDALATDGLGDKAYGTIWWKLYETDLTKALEDAGASDGTVSASVGNLEAIVAQMRYILTGLRFILRGNFQRTYQQVWREYGFQAEDY